MNILNNNSIKDALSGRLRPHFISVCQPDLEFSESVCGTVEDPRYITHFNCTGSDSSALHDMRLSFVSGHASLSSYSMWFCILYLHQRMVSRNFRLVKPLIQVGCALFAVFTSLSRVSDYKHHPEDVVFGALLGFIVSSLTVSVSAVFTILDDCDSYYFLIFQFLLKKKELKSTRATSVTSLLNVTTASSRLMYSGDNVDHSP